MRYKTLFSNNWYQSGLQYHACITCDFVLELKKIVFLVFLFSVVKFLYNCVFDYIFHVLYMRYVYIYIYI